MTAEPLVSILIPCYNAETFIGDAIRSALSQTHPNIEVIVVDDGSTDRSVEVIRAFGSAVTWESGPNRGGCVARNRALEMSKGEFIQFLDADDLLLSQKIERMLPPLLGRQADMVICNALHFETGSEPWPWRGGVGPGSTDPFIYFLDHNPGTNSPLHRRACLERIGGFRPGLPMAQEWDLHVRLGAIGVRVEWVNEWLFLVRSHDGPRIARLERKPGFNLTLLLKIADEMQEAEQLTPPRCAALANKIIKFSQYTFRSGDHALARRGFAYARFLYPKVKLPGRLPMRLLSRLLGPGAAEGLRDRFFNWLSHGIDRRTRG